MRTAGQETPTTGGTPPRIIAKVTTAPLVPPGAPPPADQPGEPLLLSSKLTVPDPPATVVERPRLMEQLRAGTSRPVTLLAAPAGWGKTALLSSWIAAGRAPKRTSWLTVEAGDDGPKFWAYLAAALTADPPARLRAPGVTDDTFLARLATMVAALPDPVVVVLDDFHLLTDPTVPQGLEFLLRHSKNRLRLVIAARSAPALPLHRWRLTGELTELRAADLAFTEEETAELLNRHGLQVPESLVRGVHTRAEGWPAGLRLAALALRDNPRSAATVTGELPAIAEYLAAELLAPLPADLRELLRRTAVVERFCAGSADALAERTDSDRLLATVVDEACGFLVPVDNQPGWYRCHRLLGDHLYAELCRQHPDDLTELHRRASQWYAEHGWRAAAMRHALTARDWSAAATHTAELWPQLILCGHDDTLRAPLPPLPAEVVRANPLIALAYAADRLDLGDHGGAAEHLRHAEKHVAPNAGDTDKVADTVAGEVDAATVALAAGRLACAELAGDLTDMARMADDLAALCARAAEPIAAHARVIARTALGEARFALGDLIAAQATFAEAAAAAAACGFTCAQRRAHGWHALTQAVAGELTAAEATARNALTAEACPARRCTGHGAAAHLALALVAQERERRAEAEREAQRAAELAASPILAAAVALVRARTLATADETDRALETLVAARRALPEACRGGHLHDWLVATEAQLRAARGDIDQARDLLTAAAGQDPRPLLAVALAELHVRAGDPAAAVAALPAAGGDSGALATRLVARTVEAAARTALGERRRAHQLVEEALDLATPHGHRRVFTQGGADLRALLAEHLDTGTAHRALVSELLNATAPGKDDHSPTPGLTEPLTERELTILRYLQSTLSNGEIAAELFLSVNTVKTHVRNIYQKLGAPRRREAVRRARELRLL